MKSKNPLEVLRAAYEKGDRFALLLAVEHVLREAGRAGTAPEWVEDEFCDAVYDYEGAYARTLDDAFQLSRPSGKHWDSIVRRERYGFYVSMRVAELIAAGCSKREAISRVAKKGEFGSRFIGESWQKHGESADRLVREFMEIKKEELAQFEDHLRQTEPDPRRRARRMAQFLREKS